MRPPDLHPEARKILERLTGPEPSHRNFIGEPIDWTKIDALDLGDLWVAARAVDRDAPDESLARDTARSVSGHCLNVQPAFRAGALRDCLNQVATRAENDRQPAPTADGVGHHHDALYALVRTVEWTTPGLGAAAKRIVSGADWQTTPHAALALARLADAAFQAAVLEKLALDQADSPLLVDELRILAEIDFKGLHAVTRTTVPHFGVLEGLEETDAALQLSSDSRYAAFAEVGLRTALERARAIHRGEVRFVADKAFTHHERGVIARLVRTALDRDESWLPPVLDELFRKVSVAPTKAKTLPSQTVAIALGRAIEAFPTPEAIATLRVVVGEVRHAGVLKKLDRNVRGAELNLVKRPALALRLPQDQPLTKSQVTTIVRVLDGSMIFGLTMPIADWRLRLAEHPQLAAITAGLIWTVEGEDGTTILPTVNDGRLALRDAAGAALPIPTEGRIGLWHPADATSEQRDAWRDRLATLKIKQPFKQAFREHYAVPAEERESHRSETFAGHVVSVVPFLGLARREGWTCCDVGLSRAFGSHTVLLGLSDTIYPGFAGEVTTQAIGLQTLNRTGTDAVSFAALPSRTLSEIFRAIDLIVSVGSFALAGDEDDQRRDARLSRLAQNSLAPMAEMRKEALRRALAGLDGLCFDSHHARLGAYAIHLATGRVTRNGDPVMVDLPKRPTLAAVPWLPYDEKLLEQIAQTAFVLASRP